MGTALVPRVVAGLVSLAACNGDRASGPTDPTLAARPSVAYLAGKPGPGDACPDEVHNSYAVIGPDGKLCPTWHPPVDPVTGCSFGHEHGRDPRGSSLYARVGDIPFGCANEQLDTWDPNAMRHVGHQVEWENGVQMYLTEMADALLNVPAGPPSRSRQSMSRP